MQPHDMNDTGGAKELAHYRIEVAKEDLQAVNLHISCMVRFGESIFGV